MFKNECCSGTDLSTHLIDSMSVMHALLNISKYHFGAQNQGKVASGRSKGWRVLATHI